MICLTKYSGKTTRSFAVIWYKSHTAPTASRQHSASVLKMVYLMMHIFSKTTNDVGVLKQRLVNSNNTPVTALHSVSKTN